jgi:ferrous iron transport protein B
VYIVLAGTFFAANAGTVIFMIYLLGIAVAILTGRLFRTVLLKGEDAPFVMELPPYRMPMIRSLLIHMWDRSKMFLRKMGGIILAGSIVVWALSAFPKEIDYSRDYESEADGIRQAYLEKMEHADSRTAVKLLQERDGILDNLNKEKDSERAEKTYIGRIGKIIEPVFAPVGIDWRGSVGLLSGFVAKEIVVSTMGVLYAVEGDSESDALRHALRDSGMTPLSALSMMVFVLLYVPCLATIGAITRETGSIKWTIFNIVYTTAVAWTMSFIVYQGGRLLGF